MGHTSWHEHIGGLDEMSLPEAGASISLPLRDLRSMRFSEAYSRARTLLQATRWIRTIRSRVQSESAKGEDLTGRWREAKGAVGELQGLFMVGAKYA